MSQRGSRITLALGAFLALVTLTGCGNSGDAARSLSSPSPIAKTAVHLNRPLDVSTQAKMAVLHYLAVLNAALRTGEVGTLKTLSAPGCGCREMVRLIQHDWTNGYVRGASVRLIRLRIEDVHGWSAAVEVLARVSPYEKFARDGHLVYQSAGGLMHNSMSLIKEAGGWLIVDSLNV